MKSFHKLSRELPLVPLAAPMHVHSRSGRKGDVVETNASFPHAATRVKVAWEDGEVEVLPRSAVIRGHEPMFKRSTRRTHGEG